MQIFTESRADYICRVTIAKGTDGHKQYHPYVIGVESLFRMVSKVAARPEKFCYETHRCEKMIVHGGNI